MTRPRVLLMTHGLAIGSPGVSIDRMVFELVRALDRDRVEPVLCGLYSMNPALEGPLIAQLRDEGILAILGGPWDGVHPYQSFFRAWKGILRQLKGQRIDIIHSHFEFSDGIAFLVAAPLRCRVLVRTVHQPSEWRRRRARRLLLTNLLWPLSFRTEIGVSQQVADGLSHRPLARLLGKKALCLYIARDFSAYAVEPEATARGRKRQELGLGADDLVIGVVGRLVPQKGYPVLLEAMARVAAEHPNAHLVIIGEGEQDGLRAQAQGLGIDRCVHLVGARSDVPELLAAMDLFASSSLWEGFPAVIVEAMTARVPVVATDVSGTRELIEDGVTGLLAPPGDPEALARAIVRVITDRGSAAERAERGFVRAQGVSLDKVARQHAELYEGLVLGRLRQGPSREETAGPESSS